jgi:hypothetical protein
MPTDLTPSFTRTALLRLAHPFLRVMAVTPDYALPTPDELLRGAPVPPAPSFGWLAIPPASDTRECHRLLRHAIASPARALWTNNPGQAAPAKIALSALLGAYPALRGSTDAAHPDPWQAWARRVTDSTATHWHLAPGLDPEAVRQHPLLSLLPVTASLGAASLYTTVMPLWDAAAVHGLIERVLGDVELQSLERRAAWYPALCVDGMGRPAGNGNPNRSFQMWRLTTKGLDILRDALTQEVEYINAPHTSLDEALAQGGVLWEHTSDGLLAAHSGALAKMHQATAKRRAERKAAREALLPPPPAQPAPSLDAPIHEVDLSAQATPAKRRSPTAAHRAELQACHDRIRVLEAEVRGLRMDLAVYRQHIQVTVGALPVPAADEVQA